LTIEAREVFVAVVGVAAHQTGLRAKDCAKRNPIPIGFGDNDFGFIPEYRRIGLGSGGAVEGFSNDDIAGGTIVFVQDVGKITLKGKGEARNQKRFFGSKPTPIDRG